VATALIEGGVSVPVRRLAVSGMPTSGKPDELLAAAGIDAAAIAEAVRGLVATPSSKERSA
jgi:transketolase